MPECLFPARRTAACRRFSAEAAEPPMKYLHFVRQYRHFTRQWTGTPMANWFARWYPDEWGSIIRNPSILRWVWAVLVGGGSLVPATTTAGERASDEVIAVFSSVSP